MTFDGVRSSSLLMMCSLADLAFFPGLHASQLLYLFSVSLSAPLPSGKEAAALALSPTSISVTYISLFRTNTYLLPQLHVTLPRPGSRKP
jgi:hypothetical protein